MTQTSRWPKDSWYIAAPPPKLRVNDYSMQQLLLGITAKIRMSYYEYEIFVGPESAFSTYSRSLVAIKRVPPIWQPDLTVHYVDQSMPKYARAAKVGEIGYIISNGYRFNTAISSSYYPRKELMVDQTKKIPYYIEALTTFDLKKREITHISTSSKPSRRREDQLGNVGLPVYVEVPIDEWLMGMGRGIRTTMGAKSQPTLA